MNEHPLPMFDEQPAQSEPAPPKKPRPKPTRKRRVRKAVALKPLKSDKIKRRKRRVTKIKPAEQHHGGKYPQAVYDLIGTLMNLELPLRNFVIEVTKGLSK